MYSWGASEAFGLHFCRYLSPGTASIHNLLSAELGFNTCRNHPLFRSLGNLIGRPRLIGAQHTLRVNQHGTGDLPMANDMRWRAASDPPKSWC